MGVGEPLAAEGRRSDGSVASVEDPTSKRTDPAGAELRGHAQLEALLDAVTAVSADLELSEVLGRIVRTSCALVNARYGALGVLSPDGEHLVEFVTHGVSAEERELIGDPPRGHGVLGLLISDPRPRRLADITAHPDSYGFPPHHPHMTSFLGTPILIRNEVFGNLYLAERQGGHGFTAADESILVALAAAAGVAIENARLYERAQRQRRWAEATGTLTQSLLEGDDEDRALRLMVELVCGLTGSAMCAVALRDEAGYVSVRATHLAAGEPAGPRERPDDWPMLDGQHWAEVFGASQDLLLLPGPDTRGSSAVVSAVASIAGLDAAGPVAIVPIPVGVGDIGFLLLAWSPEKAEAEAASDAMADLAAFAQQAGLALTAARAQHDRALVAMLEDRDRIARDMHDHVIQRLFATGLSLQSAGRLAVHPLVQQRLDEAVDSLDDAIKDIRSTIFDLHANAGAPVDPVDIEGIVRSYADSLGFEPRLELTGDVTALEESLQDDVAAVIREGLSNMSRHARAGTGCVRLTCGPTVLIEIIDDGVGIGAGGRSSGLANLERRATSRSGSFTVAAALPTGTRLTWSVPVRTRSGRSAL
ncbi:two-component system sensor histidine kinase [Intrasporangium mesophilum]